jgi:PAS domain S-box-containing protein
MATHPHRADRIGRVAARAPLGFAIFLVCVAISSVFEIVRFPDRRGWMLGFAAGFVLLVGVAWGFIRRRPTWAVGVLVGFVNVVGVALNAYHVIVGGSVAMCVWTLTGLLATSALVLPWGSRNQAFASLGALLSYPLHLEAGAADPLTWSAGAAYLLVVVSLAVFGASLFARYEEAGLELTATLSEREARLQGYLDLALIGTAVLSLDGTFREVNVELCRMFGHARDRLLELAWLDLVHPEERASAAALLAGAMAGGGGPRRREMRCVREDGETLHGIVSMCGLPGPTGAIDHVMMLVQDITPRKLAETERERYLARAEAARREAEEANRAKDAFLATVSHELRTPLTPILAWSEVLRQEEVDAAQRTSALAAIQRSARAQARLIDDLLDVSRMVSGEWRLTFRSVDLLPIVRTAVEVVRPAAVAKGVALETSLPATAVPVQVDAERLQQVIWNLVSNAVKFTPAGGRIDVAVGRLEDRCRITVRDTGEGIKPDFLPYVFDRFRQADNSTTRRHGGLGLGLTIVRALVERHRGRVWAESQGEGRGAAFVVELPILAIDAHEKAPARDRMAEAPPSSLDGLHVLVVDDDVESTAVVSALLASCGADVRTAGSTAEALEIANRWHLDVLVSDIAMPGEDGCTLLRKIRARGGALGRVPAVALTAYAGTADRSRVLEAGFQVHLAKPFDPLELAAIVGSAAHTAPHPAA